MTQETYVATITFVYGLSSYLGCGLFSYLWLQAHRDRKGLRDELRANPQPNGRLKLRIAVRNEAMGAILSIAFFLYAAAATLGAIRILDIIYLPWEPGLVTVTMLVVGNFMEMLLGATMVSIRRSVNSA